MDDVQHVVELCQKAASGRRRELLSQASGLVAEAHDDDDSSQVDDNSDVDDRSSVENNDTGKDYDDVSDDVTGFKRRAVHLEQATIRAHKKNRERMAEHAARMAEHAKIMTEVELVVGGSIADHAGLRSWVPTAAGASR